MSNCFLLLMISISFINGMETNKSKFSFSIVSHGTKINLSKSSKLSDNIDLVFTGAREERIPSYYGPLHGLNRYCEENGLNRYRKENVGILGDFKLYDNPNIKIPIVGII